ncbi:hypothetical protein LCGC14_2129500, partial [marine sediment metagenome]
VTAGAGDLILIEENISNMCLVHVLVQVPALIILTADILFLATVLSNLS